MGIGKTVAYYNVTAQILSDHDTTCKRCSSAYFRSRASILISLIQMMKPASSTGQFQKPTSPSFAHVCPRFDHSSRV